MYIYVCPKCDITLKKSSGPFGIFWLCPNCSGKAVSISVLRHSVPDSIVNEFWLRVKSKEFPEKKKCPSCNRLMSEVPIMQGEKTIFLDICKKCSLIWFDSKEFESLPHVEIPKEKLEKLPLNAREALVKLQIDKIQKKYESEEKIESLNPGVRDLIDIVFYLMFIGM
jgi:Zn-finger nucleic acid-binding protein